MGFVFKEPPKENVNVSPSHPLHEFALLMGGLGAILLASWGVLGLAVDWIVPRIDQGSENQLAMLYKPLLDSSESGRGTALLQKHLDQLLALQYPNPKQRPAYFVHLQANKDVNALALPGGHILVLGGLLSQAESENEVVFILGHELGHLIHRDHLRGLGRSLVMFTFANALFGNQNFISGLAENSLRNLQLRFSRKQESAADQLGLELLVKTYGHAGGATAFFERLAHKETGPRFLSYLNTHPHPQARVEALEALIQSRGYSLKPIQPISSQLKKAAAVIQASE
jgi:predicted Zn-dependent protease